jgi:cytochrome c oxidase assembly protein subunit 15
VCLQLMLIRRISPKQQKTLNLAVSMKWLIGIILAITAYQMFLGTQVREYIDQLTQQGLGRDSWTSQFGWAFLIHRSFSWAVLVLMVVLVFLNYKTDRVKSIYWAFLVLAIELLGGILLAYADMPGFVQVSHLLCAVVLFGILFMQFIRLRPLSKSLTKNSIRG